MNATPKEKWRVAYPNDSVIGDTQIFRYFFRALGTVAGRYSHHVRLVGLQICLAAGLAACVTIPPGSSLNAAAPIAFRIPRTAWVHEVRITDPSVQSPKVLEGALQGNLADFVRETACFEDVQDFPGKVPPHDVTLDFIFDRYSQKRTPHPAYFPAAILTMTLYIWFGGPIYEDVANMSGLLIVREGSGRRLTEVKARINEAHGVSLWSPEYVFASGIAARTALMQQLVQQACAELHKKTAW